VLVVVTVSSLELYQIAELCTFAFHKLFLNLANGNWVLKFVISSYFYTL